MQPLFTFSLLLLLLDYCVSFTSWSNLKTNATVTSISIRKPRVSGSSARLSLINYRFNKRPKRKHMNVQELKMIIGTAFNSQYMSIEPPPKFNLSDRGAIYVARQDSWRYGEMIKELQKSNLTKELQMAAGSKLIIGPEHVKTVEKWLLKKASCPVRYTWEDIGAMFWPRYIRRGDCSTDAGSCSWPSGMHCVPSGTINVQILRWQCRTKNRGRRKLYKRPASKEYNKEDDKTLNLKCSWIRVPYPITNECMCTC